MNDLIEPVGVVVTALTILIVVMIVVVMLFATGEKQVPAPVYRLGEEWTYGPLLLSAVDELPVGGHSGAGHGHDASEITAAGGAAHGTW